MLSIGGEGKELPITCERSSLTHYSSIFMQLPLQATVLFIYLFIYLLFNTEEQGPKGL